MRAKEHRLSIIAAASAFPAAFLSLTPILFVSLWALCGTSTLGLLGSPTLRWFREVLTDESWQVAFVVSSVLALAASTIGLFLASITGFFVKLRLDRYEQIATSIILLPLLVPSIVYGLSMQYVGGRLAFPEWLTISVADVALVLPIQYLVIRSAHGHMAVSQLEAALTLGATPLQALFRVYFPVMARPLLAAWAFGTFAVIDEIVVLKFVWGAAYQPAALKLWSLIGKTLNPAPAVFAITVLILSAIAVGVVAAVGYSDHLVARWHELLGE